MSSNLTSPTIMRIILASQSPARKKLLAEIGLKFEVIPADIDEEKISDPMPSRRVKKLALLKAKAVWKRLSHGGNEGYEGNGGKNWDVIIIAADTLVYLPTANSRQPTTKFIGKPKDLKHAKEILTLLSGSTHWLYTGICVIYALCHPEFISGSRNKFGMTTLDLKQVQHDNCKIFLDYDKTRVFFRKLSSEEINSYIADPEVLNQAGAYTIEKTTFGAGFIKKIKGSYSNVLGLPVEKLKKILSDISDSVTQ